MTALATEWIYWIIATVGVAGAIALFVFVPATFWLIASALGRFFKWVLSSRIGCALLAAVLVFFLADLRRHKIDDAAFAEQTKEFKEAQAARDKKAAADTDTWVEQQIAAGVKTELENRNAVDAFTKGLPVSNVFRIGADRDRLRLIAGEPLSKSPLRLPAAARPNQAP